MIDSIANLFDKYHLVAAFAVIGLTMYVAYWISNNLTRGKLHGSAIAIILGLVLAYVGGINTGGKCLT